MTLTRRHLLRSFLLLLLALAMTPARAAENYLKLIPGTALAWGAVNNMGEAAGKVQKLAALMPMPPANVLEEIKKEEGLQKGLDEKGAAGFFVVPGKTAKDTVTAMFVAVADEKEFLGNFAVVKAGEKVREVEVKTATSPKTTTHYLALWNGYAVLAPKSDRAAVEACADAKQSIAAEMAGLESWVAENDGTVVGTAAGIKFMARQAAEELKKSKAGGPGTEAEMPAVYSSFMSFYGKAFELAPSELSLVLAGIRCDKESSIRIIGRARLVNGGLVSKAIAGMPPVTQNLLAGVPGGPFVFAAGAGLPKLAESYLDLFAGLMKSTLAASGMSAEDAQRVSKEISDACRQVRSLSVVMKTGKRGDPIYSNVFSAMGVENSQRMLDLLEQVTEDANKLVQKAKPGMVKSLTVKRLEIGGKPALQQEVNFDLAKMAVTEADRAVMDEMMGIGGKMLLYHVAADEHTVLMGIGISQERMAAALDVLLKQPRKSLAEDADVSVAAAMLPVKAQWVAYVSPRGFSQLEQRMMSAAIKNQQEAMGFSMPPFPKSPPLGFAVKATPAEFEADIAFPAPLIQAYGDYEKEVQNMFMNRAKEQNPTPVP